MEGDVNICNVNVDL